MANDLGQPAAASFILGGYAAGSLVVGLIYGALKLEVPRSRQFAIAIAVAAATTIPLLFVPNIPLLAFALFVSGVSISPTFITAFSLIERLVPAAKLTEGITWIMTGIGIGMAIGSAASGWVGSLTTVIRADSAASILLLRSAGMITAAAALPSAIIRSAWAASATSSILSTVAPLSPSATIWPSSVG
jgi:MFS family permease